MLEGKKFKEPLLWKKNCLRYFSNSNIFIIASNWEKGSQFHLLQSNSHGLPVIHVESVSIECFR